jgi:hypothetical protein
LNKQLEKILEAAIASSDENNTTSIDNISHLVSQPNSRVSSSVHFLKDQKLVRPIDDGYLIQLTPSGLKYFETQRKNSPTVWIATKTHLLLPIATFIVVILIGLWLSKLL